MRLSDIFLMALQDLWQRKLRTSLNLIGVVIGSIMLLLTAAGATGSSAALRRLFDSSEVVRQIWVQPMYWYSPEPPEDAIVVADGLGPERQARIKDAMTDAWKSEHQLHGLAEISPEKIEELRAIPEVLRVIPHVSIDGVMYESDTGESFRGQLVGIDPQASRFSAQLIVGETLADSPSNEVLVSEWLAYRMGYRSIDELQELVGKTIVLRYQLGTEKLNWMYSMLAENYNIQPEDLAEQAKFAIAFQRLLGDLDATSLNDEQKQLVRGLTEKIQQPEAAEEKLSVEQRFTVRGVIDGSEEAGSPSKLFRMWFQNNSTGDLFVHHARATKLYLENPDNESFHNATVIVQSADALKPVSDAIEEKKMNTTSAVWLWENIQARIRGTTWVVYGIALAILLASALGISNTLLISVLQRTPEFGILKSVGARDRDLVLLMLSEGVLLGVVGATLALACGILVSLAGNRVLASYIANRSGEEVSGSLFHFSWQPIAFIYVMAIGICAVASMLPAWRAARLDPVVAMRRT